MLRGFQNFVLVKNIFFIFSIVFVLLTVGCKTEKTSTKTYSDELNSIVLSQKKVVRNVSFGDTREQIKDLEGQHKVIVENGNRLAFEVNLANEEFADINYSLMGDKVDMINVDIYKNDISTANSLFQEFLAYYTDLNGEPTASTAEEVTWTDKDKKYNISLLIYNTEEDPGLELQFSPIN